MHRRNDIFFRSARRRIEPLAVVFRTGLSFACAIVIASGCAPGSDQAASTDESPPPKNAITAERLRQIVAAAHEGREDGLEWFETMLQRNKDTVFTKDTLPVLEDMLEDKLPRCQMAGARGLLQLRDPDSKGALVKFLKSKDFKELERRVYSGEIAQRDGRYEMMAASIAVLALGKVGEKDVVPLLESLLEVKDLKFEWGGSPVVQALQDLGAIEVLTKTSKDMPYDKLVDSARAMSQVRDPGKVPQLVALVGDREVPDEIRSAAVSAIAAINTPETSVYLVGVLESRELPTVLRCSAAMALVNGRFPVAEEALITLQDAESFELRATALVALSLLNPNKYISEWFNNIMDVNEDLDYRSRLSGMEYLLPRQLLDSYKQDLYACLQAETKDGLPADDIRTNIWLRINQQFGDEPEVTLTCRHAGRADTIRSRVQHRILGEPHTWEEQERLTNERFERIVRVQQANNQQESAQ